MTPVYPRTPVPSASRPALGPRTPAGASLPALSLPHQWQMQLYQLQAMQQAMASIPYTFPGQQPFQPPGFGAGDAFGPLQRLPILGPGASGRPGYPLFPVYRPKSRHSLRSLSRRVGDDQEVETGGGRIRKVLHLRRRRGRAPRCRNPMNPKL